MEKNHVTFVPQGRTGNLMFEYLACKLVQVLSNGKYKYSSPSKTVDISRFKIIEEQNYSKLLNELETSNTLLVVDEQSLLLKGYFQLGDNLVKHRSKLLEHFADINIIDDSWPSSNGETYFKDFLHAKHDYNIKPKDITISLRLDDFIQLPCPTSDILPPSFYLDILEEQEFDNLYIICDIRREEWERQYLKFFDKWNPIIRDSNSLLMDCAALRDAPRLIHSNSTICWIMSYLSTIPNKKRYIPFTHFYSNQKLCAIDSSSDEVFDVKPLSHPQVYGMCSYNYFKKYIHPLPYSIPSEYVIDRNIEKKFVLSSSRPCSEKADYKFKPHEEAEYLNTYEESYFAVTQKKGGWDCLRHYEIMSSGCIPIFPDLDKCPTQTMISFPKQLIKQAAKELDSKAIDLELYEEYRNKMLEWMEDNCTAEVTLKKYVLPYIKNPDFSKVLLIRCHEGVNYTREMFWIGMYRHLREKSSSSMIEKTIGEYPRIPYLYDDFPYDQMQNLHGIGFGYSRKLNEAKLKKKGIQLIHDQNEIIIKTKEKYWDLIVYGKVGPDEFDEGSIPKLPLWDEVKKRYNR